MDYQKLFNHMADYHDLILVETEMQDIIDIVEEIIFEHHVEARNINENEDEKKEWKERCPICKGEKENNDNYFCDSCGRSPF